LKRSRLPAWVSQSEPVFVFGQIIWPICHCAPGSPRGPLPPAQIQKKTAGAEFAYWGVCMWTYVCAPGCSRVRVHLR
jgi:hypothetical protein